MPIVINGSGSVTGITTRLAAASAPAGSVIQVVEHELNSAHQTSSGDQWHYTTLTGAITTQFDDSKVLVDQRINVCGGPNSGGYYTLSGKLYRNDAEVTGANSTASGSRPDSWWTVGSQDWDNFNRYMVPASYLDTPGNAGTYTYKVYCRDYRDNGLININRYGADADSDTYQVGRSTLTLTEVAG